MRYILYCNGFSNKPKGQPAKYCDPLGMVPVGGCLPAGRRCPGAVNIARRWGHRVAGGLTADPLTGDFT